ncbi:class I SAM-dependent methyltransferase [Streptomyces sp. NPDC127051]|uniref:class I SAM-dependent methyltransferase n=1 Tax=Streptomyces sp. NPDC127051 TaxID=3347119 RepID=UPI00364C82AD
MNDLTIASTVAIAKELYADTPRMTALKQTLRPRIAPIHTLTALVPPESSVLDVGCGAGLFTALLAKLGRIRTAVAFDSDAPAIAQAQRIAARLPQPATIHYETRTAFDPWPEGQFDVVSIIDVMHHITPAAQADVITEAARHVKAGGILLYKDMAHQPCWRAWANRLHDLISARERIHYAPLEKVITWAHTAGLHLEQRGAINMYWYAHQWCVFRADGRPVTAPHHQPEPSAPLRTAGCLDGRVSDVRRFALLGQRC